MRRITKFFVFFLLFAALTASLVNIGYYRELRERTESLYKRDLRHWLSLQARMELVEEAVAATDAPEKTEPSATNAETEIETEADTKIEATADTVAVSEADTIVEDQSTTAEKASPDR